MQRGQVGTGQVMTAQVMTSQVRTGPVKLGQVKLKQLSNKKDFGQNIFWIQNLLVSNFFDLKLFLNQNCLDPNFF